MRYTVTFELRGALAAAVAVEWTEADAPESGVAGWRPCLGLPDGRWRLAGHDSAGAAAAHWRAPGRFGNIGLRYRLTAGGPWSPVSADRKEIDIVAVSPDDPPPAARAGDWSVPAPFTLPDGLPGGGRSGAFVLGGAAAAAVAVQWTAASAPGEADWQDAVALADGRWHLGAPVAGNLDGLAIRWRLAADGPWSAASEDRKPLSFPDLPIIPVLLAAPALAGSGRIGEAVAALPGVWTGAPALGFEWCRDGAPIAGATSASYRPGPQDDRTALSCRVTATTAAGSLAVTTAGLAVRHAAPEVVDGVLDEEIFDQGPGVEIVEAAPAFRGGGLRFAVAGAGATIDALTGVIAIPTAVALEDRVVVTATNSGGAASVEFAVTVEAEVIVAPPALEAADWSIPATAEIAAGRFAGVIELGPASPAANAFALEWSDAAAPAGAGLPLTALGGRRWRMDDPSGAGRNAVGAGAAKSGIAIRYRLAADGLWSAFSEDRKGFSVPAPAAYWRSIERTAGAAISAPNNYGFGQQYVRCLMACEDEPQFIIGGGDMNGIRLSDTMGRTWYHPESDGLRAFGFNSVFIDPRNHNYLLALGNVAWFGARTSPADYLSLCGVWRSTDFGRSWTLVQQMNTAASGDEFNQSLFCYDPATRGLPVNQRRIYLMQRIRGQKQEATGQQLWVSSDGGATWAKFGPQMAESQFGGGMHILRHHPTDNTLLLGGQNGLWKSNPAKTSWTRPFSGLPNTRCAAVEIDPANGNHMYAFMFNGALWRTANGGTSWTSVYSEHPVKRGAVDWKSRPEIVYIQLNNSQAKGPTLVRSTAGNGSGPWAQPAITPAVGWPTTDLYHTRSLSKETAAPGFEAIIAPAAGVCIANAVSRIFRSEDSGARFVDSSIGFTGIGFMAFTPSAIAQRPDNPDCIAIPLQDIHVAISTDGLRSILPKQVKFDPTVFGFTKSPSSSYCVEWLPAEPGLPDGVLLLGLGDSFLQGICRSTDGGDTWQAITSNASGALRFIKKHPALNAVVGGDRISKDRGLTWPTVINGSALGVSRNGTLYVVRNANTEVWRSTDWASAATPTFTPFYQGPSFGKFGYSGPLARVSVAEENTIWCEGPGRDLIRVRNTGTTFAAAVVTPFNLAGQQGVGVGGFFELADICPDPKLANVVLVTALISGGHHIWRGTVGGSGVSGSVAWEDYTGNAPKWQDTSIQVLEDSGDILIGGGVGGWLRQCPAGWPATRASRYPQLAHPVLPGAT